MLSETSRDLIAKAIELFTQGISAAIREEMQSAERSNPSEIMTIPQASRESGYSRASISLWCRQGLIEGAYQPVPNGKWRFTRGAWERFLSTFNRRPLARLKAA